MITRMFFTVLTSLLCVSICSSAAFAQSDAEVCFPVAGTISTTFTEGCDSPFGLCTTGTSTSVFGLLNGTTSYSAQGLGGQPVAEASILTPATAEPDTTWAFGGDLILTTAYGDLIFRDIGVLDTAIGVLSEVARVQMGTGLFMGATGNLFIFGETTADGSGFDAKYRGELCSSSWPRWLIRWTRFLRH
ncbi:MAG: hypothetical protein AAGI01_00030 [Myxococcota bacterium]